MATEALRLLRERVRTAAAAAPALGPLAASRDNNFDVLRLFAAGLVLLSHCFPLTGRHEPLDPHTLGTVGVEIFFVTSGFLVARSWCGDASLRRFAAKRALRIMPGLIVAVLFTALVVGTLASSLAPGAYLASSLPWNYAVDNILMSPFHTLPTVFSGNPYPNIPNGSLWTLPIEVQAYALLAVAGVTRLLRFRTAVLAATLVVIAANAVADLNDAKRLTSLFLAGTALYLWRERVRLRPDVAVVLAVLWSAAYTTRFATAAGMVALPYLVGFAAYRTTPRLRRLTRRGDLSYGVYVYAFPVQQSLVALLGPVNPLVLFILAAPVTWLLALASWRLVEAPALRLKSRRRSTPAHAPSAIVSAQPEG